MKPINCSGRKKKHVFGQHIYIHVVIMALNEVPALFTVNKHKHSDKRQIIDQHEPVPGNSVITMHSDW